MNIYNDELYHFGVKGMRWGHRKKESKAVTKAREKFKIKNQEFEKANKAFQNNPFSKEVGRKYDIAIINKKHAKDDLDRSKILDKLSSKEKSARQIKMEEKYKRQGMNNDEAAVAAYRNIRTKNALTAIGATVLAAATAYGGYKLYDNNVDRIIKSGSKLQNISKDSDIGLRDTFYSSKNKIDNNKYRGMYGDHIRSNGEKVVSKQIKVISNIKQASYKSANNVFKDIADKDENFVNEFKKYLKTNKDLFPGPAGEVLNKAHENLSKGIIDKKVYDAFNISLVDHTPQMQKLSDKYFNEMTKKGYNAIKDINDSKYSGYKSINPIISFGTKGKVEVSKVSNLTDGDITKSKNIEVVRMFGSEMIKQGAVVVGLVLGSKAIVSAIDKAKSKKDVDMYKKQYPNTKMSNTEISRMLEKEAV